MVLCEMCGRRDLEGWEVFMSVCTCEGPDEHVLCVYCGVRPEFVLEVLAEGRAEWDRLVAEEPGLG